MIYEKIILAKFIDRPNRFIAYVDINGKIEKVHVKNTGRCKELLIKDATVVLEDCSDIPTRKTKYSLIAVYKNNKLINMDSQVPNKVIYEALTNKKIPGLENISNLKAEKTYKNSRFDIYFEKDTTPCFMEIKGVTLEEKNIARFPDAPTKRGTKHIYELVDARLNGYDTYILFLIQMDYVKNFMPNKSMDPDFHEALIYANKNGVEILAFNSKLEKNSIELFEKVKVILD